jgi:Zn-dependent peptidase ImmA (M78 family)/DNA-binding XRE family transcriptional regulator
MTKHNISQRKLAELLGVTHPTVASYIKGDKTIDSDKLLKISRYFNVPFDYFFKTSHEEFTFLFRADSPKDNFSEVDYNIIHLKLKQYNEIVGMRKISYIPQTYILSITGNKIDNEIESIIENTANEIRRVLNIEKNIPDNYYELLSSIGINVVAAELSNLSIFGVSSFSDVYGSFIFVNSSNAISEERQIFSLIHELGHLLFHRNEYLKTDSHFLYDSSSNPTSEIIANLFASYFLIPRRIVKTYIEQRNHEVDIFEMKKHFKVDIDTLYNSLYKYGYLNKKQYSDYQVKAKNLNWIKNEPDPIKHILHNDKNTKLMTSLKQLYQNEEISLNKVSEVLELTNKETRQLIKEWQIAFEHFEHLS